MTFKGEGVREMLKSEEPFVPRPTRRGGQLGLVRNGMLWDGDRDGDQGGAGGDGKKAEEDREWGGLPRLTNTYVQL